ncbi:MAG TPA: GNAT family N-acetyltransferase [Usitatibacter sp.]|nr:GNAT family N-acetyltransferase [Usitatibacter sp.]
MTALVLASPGTPAELDLVRELFREYQQSIGTDLCFQNFESELATLPGAYAPPRGRLYLGISSGEGACCAGLRACDEAAAEMKRLYVRPQHRGLGYGLALANTLIADARSLGYRRLVLDTLPAMKAAQAMYEALGFRDIEPYTFNPIAGTRYMGLDL